MEKGYCSERRMTTPLTHASASSMHNYHSHLSLDVFTHCFHPLLLMYSELFITHTENVFLNYSTEFDLFSCDRVPMVGLYEGNLFYSINNEQMKV